MPATPTLATGLDELKAAAARAEAAQETLADARRAYERRRDAGSRQDLLLAAASALECEMAFHDTWTRLSPGWAHGIVP